VRAVDDAGQAAEARPVARAVSKVLVVEDDPRLAGTLQRALAARFDEVRACSRVAEVAALLEAWRPELVILDFALPDGDATAVLELSGLHEPAPVVVVVSGAAAPEDSFELARRGVRAYLPKPLSLDELEAAIDMAITTAPAIEPHLRQVVGHRGLHDVEGEVRDVMIDEALARAQGSRRGAGRILETSRQLLQYLLRRR
jgi:DNA-binding response OmpR family regulator